MFEMILFGLVCLCAAVVFVCRYIYPEISRRAEEPWYLDYGRSFLPVLLIVFLLRGFVAEPFRIPSGSMLPTLEVGDFILVNKFTYGIRLPIIHKKILDVNEPKRGDIMVFRVPTDNKTSYIKRVIGLPGDRIDYKNKALYVNGQLVESDLTGDYIAFGETHAQSRYQQIIQTEGEAGELAEYSTLLNKRSFRRVARDSQWKVPQGHYFMMGDNRDDSLDSRVWGFMPNENIIGKAFFIWFHYNGHDGGGFKFSRVGTNIQAKTVEN